MRDRNAATQTETKVLQQITEDNRWFAAFAQAMLCNYEEKTASRLIKQTADDIFTFGYEDAKRYWQGFMDFHYPAQKEVEVSNERGHCKHGEFILLDGCPQCIAERRQQELTLASTHQSYCLTDGSTAPSVTTVLGILDKPGLPPWAWKLGKEGLDYREVRDSAARVGTLAHYLIACHLKGATPVSSGYPPDEEKKAKKCLAKYLRWEKEHPLSPVMIETPLISEECRYGGTPDLLAEIDGEFVLIDFKTGGGIYQSYFYQVAAYRKLLEEQGWPVTGARIIRISPDETDRIEVAMAPDYDRDWQIFQHALGIYTLRGDAQ